ncbi:hypothetical protein MKW92_014463, partial [Papaver armeniacum]
KIEKVLNNCPPDGSAKKPRQEDGMAMWKRQRSLRERGRKKDPETNMALKSLRNFGEANIFHRYLEDYNKQRLSDPQWSMIDLLVTGTHGNDEHFKACQQIGHALLKQEFVMFILENVEQAENLFRNLKHNGDNTGLITAVCFFMLEEIDQNVNGFLHMKNCSVLHIIKESKLLTFFNKSLQKCNGASLIDTSSRPPKPGGMMQKLKMQLGRIYHSKGMLEDFVEGIYLLAKHCSQKVRTRKLDQRNEKVTSKEACEEERKAAAIAAGLDWHSDDSDEEATMNIMFILDLCKALESLRRYWEALEIINHSLSLADNILPLENREELRSLGAQIAFATAVLISGYDYARFIVQQHPSRLENRLAKHVKFLHNEVYTHTECVPFMIILASAGEYLEAYKLMPDISLNNLCVGTALINFASHFSLAILNFPGSSQEALYDVSRACQHVGLVTLALPNEDSSIEETKKSGTVTLKDTAYNLHLICMMSGALDLVRQVLKDHCPL